MSPMNTRIPVRSIYIYIYICVYYNIYSTCTYCSHSTVRLGAQVAVIFVGAMAEDARVCLAECRQGGLDAACVRKLCSRAPRGRLPTIQFLHTIHVLAQTTTEPSLMVTTQRQLSCPSNSVPPANGRERLSGTGGDAVSA